MKKHDEPYKQLPDVLIEEMEKEIRGVRKLILYYIDRLNRNTGLCNTSLDLLGQLLTHEQELLDIYMKDYNEMRKCYADKGLVNIP